MHRRSVASFALLLLVLLTLLLLPAAAGAASPTGIQGTVTDTSGARLRNVTVDVYRSDHMDPNYGGSWSQVASVRTDAGGTYKVTGLAADKYFIRFAEGSTVFIGQDQYTTVLGGTMVTVNASLQRCAKISGVVTGVGDAPLADATVTLWHTPADWWWYGYPVASVTTDATGRYTFSGVIPSDESFWYAISFDKADYVSEWYDDITWWWEASHLQVGGGQSLTGIDARLTGLSHITGHVGDASGTGLPWIQIEVMRLDTAGNWGWYRWTQTDENGDYDAVVAPGTYRVRYYDGYGTYKVEWFDDAADLEHATDIPVAEGASATADAVLAPIAYGSISGTVRGHDGAPLHAWVTLLRFDGTWWSGVSQVWTDASGAYKFERLPATAEGEAYYVEFDNDDHLTEFFDDASSLETATGIQLSEGQDRTGVDAQLASLGRGRIAGSVKDGATGLEYVEVQFYRANDGGGWDAVDYTGTDASGNYSKSLDPGIYRVGYRDTRWPKVYTDQFYPGASDVGSATDVEVVADTTTGGIDVTMQRLPASSISGTVTDVAGRPVEGARADLWVQWDPWYGWMVRSTTTDADGHYELAGLPVGACPWAEYYVIRFSHPDYQAEYYDDAMSVWSATGWESLDEAGLSGIDAQLERAGALGHITGRVTGPDDAAVAGMEVVALRKAGPGPWDWSWVQWAQTDADGVYDLGELEPGRYTVYFNGVDDFAPEYYDDVVREDQATSFRVEYGSTVSGIDAVLATYGHISGHVSDAAGVPLAGVSVEFWESPDASCSWGSTSTDENGDYDSGRLPAGDWYVEFGGYGGEPALRGEWYNDAGASVDADAVPVALGQTTTGIDAVLTDGAELAGRVTDPDGNALEGVEVRAYNRRMGWGDTSFDWVQGMAVTDVSGGYQIAALPGDDYRIGFYDPQGRYGGEYFDDAAVIADATHITLPRDGTVAAIDASLTAGGRITGTITGPDGVGVGGVTVEAYFKGPGQRGWWSYPDPAFNDDSVKTTTTAADGTYEFTNLSTGRHRIRCQADDYHTRWYVDSPDRRGSTPVFVPRGETVAGIDVQLIPAGRITGQVTKTDGTPVTTGGTVDAIRVDEYGNEQDAYSTTIRDDGSYTLSRLVAGTFRIRFAADGYLTEWWDDVPDGLPWWDFVSQVDTVEVADGQATTGIDATLTRESTISGVVTGPDGTPVADVWVRAEQNDVYGGYHYSGAYTNAAGEYTICGLRAGTWSMAFYPPPPLLILYDGFVDVGVEQDIAGIDAQLDSVSAQARLGQKILDDTDLSTPVGQSCSTCHAPEVGYTGPDSAVNVAGAVYQGACDDRFGNRKPPTIAYAGNSPTLYRTYEGDWVGGMFWDGRASGWMLGDPLTEQARGPFLNPLEQNMAGPRQVVDTIAKSDYASLFREVYGPSSLTVRKKGSADAAYDSVAAAIAQYERSSEVSAFSSKYDAWLNWQVDLNDQEMQGRELFNGKANCGACHPAGGRDYWEDRQPLFTDYTYDNLGVPKNGANPFYSMPVGFNPAGEYWVDEGLGGFLRSAGWSDGIWVPQVGKFKVPTLRNVDKRPSDGFVKAYGHNGYFKSLEEIVHFYNTRDVPGEGWNGRPWPEAEVSANMNTEELGNLGLTAEEEAAIVAFLKTLSDGWVAPTQ